jgi:hypothetical protein
LAIWREVTDRDEEASALANIGSAYDALGERREAQSYYDQALDLSRAAGDRRGEAETLYRMARLARDGGQFINARARIEAALDLTESLRADVADPQMRASYLASKQTYYQFYTDLLMQWHQRQPSERFNATALEASERARARSLLDLLTEAGADIRHGVEPDLLQRERSLRQRLNTQEQVRLRLLGEKPEPAQIKAVERELNDLLRQYQEVQGQIRVKSPRYAALMQPQPLGLQQIQQQVLDEDTILLEYALGQERSYLWAVTPTAISSFEMPRRAEIEAAARRFYELITARKPVRFEMQEKRQARVARADADYPAAAMALSRMLLGPVAGQLGKKRLLIVADGALHYVPFGALPAPDSRPKTQDPRP